VVPAWTTRVPGLVVTPNSACTETPDGWPRCYSVYVPNWGQHLPLCFPQKICGAAFADMLAHIAPWGTGSAVEICSGILAVGWKSLATQAVCIGGVHHAEGS
jgi:hypothetical protein